MVYTLLYLDIRLQISTEELYLRMNWFTYPVSISMSISIAFH
jgi:hypothetical protein